jgi:hypothetical protein
MLDLKAVRIAVFALAILAVLWLAVASVRECGQDDCCARGTCEVCQICHLGLLGVEVSHAEPNMPAPEALGAVLVVEELDFRLGPITPRTPSRAPPTL